MQRPARRAHDLAPAIGRVELETGVRALGAEEVQPGDVGDADGAVVGDQIRVQLFESKGQDAPHHRPTRRTWIPQTRNTTSDAATITAHASGDAVAPTTGSGGCVTGDTFDTE